MNTRPWVSWEGGKCPVDPDTMVRYRMRSQHLLGEEEYDVCAAGDLDWEHGNQSRLFTTAAEIVAYQVYELPLRSQPEAWVSEMKLSDGRVEFWVNIGYKGGKYLSNRFHYTRGRAEFEVAEWNHLFGHCEEPDMFDYDTEEPK